ncbi:hypothetical protein [Marinomonas piezotolerans]|nr:hypothetical protein [Marinomonas piezotolerans]
MMITTGKRPTLNKRFRLTSTHLGVNDPASNWDVTPTDNYRLACLNGRRLAACYLLQIQSDPSLAGTGLLGHIAGDIDFQDQTATKGHWVGFFSYLEEQLYKAASICDIYLDLAKAQQQWDDIAAQRVQLEKQEENL